MAYKLIAIDLDGTLLSDEKKLLQKNIEAMQAAINAGAEVMIATGRPYRAAIGFMEQAGIEGLILSIGGALVNHYPGGETIYESYLPGDLVSEIADFSRENDWFFYFIAGTDYYYEKACDKYFFMEKYFGFPGRILDYKSVHGRVFNKGNVIVESDVIIDVAKALDDKFGDRAEFLIADKNVIDITPKGILKGVTLLNIAAHRGLTAEQVIAIGDANSDISMIEAAGLGVCMENGTPETIAAADYIAPSNNDCGVAHVIEKFVLNPNI